MHLRAVEEVNRLDAEWNNRPADVDRPQSILAKKPRETRAPSNELVTEDQAAIEFARRHAGSLRFCHDVGAWYEWKGSIWRQNRTGLAFQFARQLARDLAVSESDRVRYISSKTSFAAGVERFARSDPEFAATSEHWDVNPMLLGTPGGTVDLTTGILAPAAHSTVSPSQRLLLRGRPQNVPYGCASCTKRPMATRKWFASFSSGSAIPLPPT